MNCSVVKVTTMFLLSCKLTHELSEMPYTAEMMITIMSSALFCFSYICILTSTSLALAQITAGITNNVVPAGTKK